MPKITAHVDGAELTFCPIRLEHFRKLQSLEEEKMSWIQRVDFWMPIIRESVEEAGGGSIPDIEKMNIEKAMDVFGELLAGLLEASGVKKTGEAKPVLTSDSSGAMSSASS